MQDLEVGQEVRADLFQPGDYVDVTGTSKGKGFAGVDQAVEFRAVGPMATVPCTTGCGFAGRHRSAQGV